MYVDLFNIEVLAWKLSNRNDLHLVLDTIKQLDAPEALLHSDPGFQYTTKTYARLLEENTLKEGR